MNRRDFMKMCITAAAVPVVGIPAVAKSTTLFDGLVGFWPFRAGEAIDAGKMVSVASDGLGYMAYREKVILGMAKALSIPDEVLR